MLVALGHYGRTLAHAATRGAAFACPQCGEALTLKRGRVVVAHFAHHPGSACSWGSGESATHLAAKRAFLDAFAARGLEADAEVEVLSGEGDRRADVLVRHPSNGARIAIEIQHSALALDAIEARSRDYAAAGVPVIWVPTLAVSKLAARAVPGMRLLHVARHTAPPWQRWIDARGDGTWFWDDGRLWRGWLSESWLARAPDPGLDPFADTGWQPSRRWAGLTLEGPFTAGDLRIALRSREAFGLLERPVASFVVGDERRPPPAPSVTGWVNNDGHLTPSIDMPGVVPPRVSVVRKRLVVATTRRAIPAPVRRAA